MTQYHVVKTERLESGSILHFVDDGESNLRKIQYRAIRAGLHWPTPSSPAYYVIIAEEDRPILMGKKEWGKLHVLVEKEVSSLILNELFQKLTDDSALYRCNSIHTDLNEEDQRIEEYKEYFQKWKSRNQVTRCDLVEAPYSSDISLGISCIHTWIDNGLLEMPEGSAVRAQLSKISRNDLADPLVTEKFYALDAFRFVMAAIDINRSSGLIGFQPRRRLISYPRKGRYLVR